MQRSIFQAAALAALVLMGSGCYHARIETGAAPSDVVVRQTMASAWLWGLVKPPLTNVMSQCPAGVATVETRHSVLNGIVHILTGGIYTPMTIVVTCAKAGEALAVPDGAPVYGYDPREPGALDAAVRRAAQWSADAGSPVMLRPVRD